MSRPKKIPGLREQLEAVVLKAMGEKKFDVAEVVLDILANLDKPKEGENGITSDL